MMTLITNAKLIWNKKKLFFLVLIGLNLFNSLSNAQNCKEILAKSYIEMPWSHYFKQVENVIEVKVSVNKSDYDLWEKTIQNGKNEVGLFQAFDYQDRIILESTYFIGGRHSISGQKSFPVWKSFLGDLYKLRTQAEIKMIRMTHTHPRTGFGWKKGTIGFFEPGFLSPGDLNVGLYFRKYLNDLDLSAIDFQMTAIAKKKNNISGSLSIIGFLNKAKDILNPQLDFDKPTFLFLGREILERK